MKTLSEMGEAARRCSNVDYRGVMQGALMDVLTTMQAFENYPSADTLRALNCEWANATRIYANVPTEADPAPTSGAAEPARLAA